MSVRTLSRQLLTTANYNKLISLKGSVVFDGTGDYVLPSSATNATNFGTGDFTCEFFYRPVANGQQNCIDNFGNSGVAIYRDGSGYMNYYVGANRISSTTTINNNTWYHIALVRSSGTSKLYINGTKEGSDYSDSTNFGGGADFPRIGISFANTVGVNGYMSNLRIVKSAVYNSNFTKPASSLSPIFNTTLLTLQHHNEIIDRSSNAFRMTTYGNAAASSTHPF